MPASCSETSPTAAATARCCITAAAASVSRTARTVASATASETAHEFTLLTSSSACCCCMAHQACFCRSILVSSPSTSAPRSTMYAKGGRSDASSPAHGSRRPTSSLCDSGTLRPLPMSCALTNVPLELRSSIHSCGATLVWRCFTMSLQWTEETRCSLQCTLQRSCERPITISSPTGPRISMTPPRFF